MSLRQRILDDMKAAMKSRETARLGTIRLLKAKMQEREVELRSSKGRDHTLTDEEVLEVLARAAKQRKDSIESYESAGRDDLAAKERAELEIVESYLPAAMGEDEVKEIVRQAVEEAGASSPRDMGAVMKLVMPKVKGRADGKLVNALVKAALGG
jgi:uncharacterized protein YqeY